MIRECIRTGADIKFLDDSFQRIGLDQKELNGEALMNYTTPPFPQGTPQILEVRDEPSSEAVRKERDARHSRLMAKLTKDKTLKTPDKPMLNPGHEELHDALSPAYDQINRSWFWWFAEMLKLPQPRKEGNVWKYRWIWNLFAGRKIQQYEGEVYWHRSVERRQTAEVNAKSWFFRTKREKYLPKASLAEGSTAEVVYVDY